MPHHASVSFHRPQIWLAADRDGAVGVFSAGKAGAVPLSVTPFTQDDRSTILAATARAAPQHDPTGRFEPGRTAKDLHLTARWEGSLGKTIVALRFLTASAEAAIADGGAEILDSDYGIVLRFKDLTSKTAAGLHRERACKMCYWPHRAPFDSEALATAGFYPYQHLCEAWIPGPYGRPWIPRDPLRIDQTPPALRRALEATQFSELCFATYPHIQPAEILACHLPDEHYMGSDGEIRLPNDERV